VKLTLLIFTKADWAKPSLGSGSEILVFRLDFQNLCLTPTKWGLFIFLRIPPFPHGVSKKTGIEQSHGFKPPKRVQEIENTHT